MAKVFQIFVPDNTLVSRIISCETQVTELYVIDRADKKFPLLYTLHRLCRLRPKKRYSVFV